MMSNSIVAKDVETDRKYPCPLCEFGTEFRNSIRRHIIHKHPDVDIGPGEKGHRVAGNSKVILKRLLLKDKIRYE